MADDESTWAAERDRQPSVCIVVPARAPAAGLPRVIEKLMAQRYEGTVEVLVVIDGAGRIPDVPAPPSLTGTLRRALRTIVNTQEPGLEGARRTGRMAAGAELVVYCGADEEWPPDRLREVVLRRFVGRGSVQVRRHANG